MCQDDWDNSGVQVCPNPNDIVTSIVLSSDINFDVINYAQQQDANLIITHHPLFMPFNAITSLQRGCDISANDTTKQLPTAKDVASEQAVRLIQALDGKGITHLALHTNLDKAKFGIAHSLALLFSLDESSLRAVIPELDNSEIGHGRIGNISHSLLCKYTDKAITVGQYAKHIQQLLQLPEGFIRVNQTDLEQIVDKVAILPGSGAEMIQSARALGADTVITADLKHHMLNDENLISKLLGSNLIIIELPHNIMEFAAMESRREYEYKPVFYNVLHDIDLNTKIHIYDPIKCCPWGSVI